jgi:serine/threonine protein kinase
MAIKIMSRHNALFSTNYIAGRHLGIGATSRVFECYARNSNDKFAAKKAISKDIIQFNRSKKEEAYLEKLNNHPNICNLHDIFYEEDDDGQYVKHIVTECGENSLANLASTVHIDENYLKQIVIQMLHAILHCHNNNICHRDIKLENFIYINSYNLSHASPMFLNTINIKLIDFGLATNYHKDYNLTGKVGTVSYVAPEILNNSDYTPKIDSWSLGVSIYKIIIGNPLINHTKIDFFNPTYKNHKWNTYSTECCDFVQQLLTINAINRLSIHDAINHSWVCA